MKSLKNRVQLIGHLGQNPEVKEYEGKKKASFSVATNYSYKNGQGEQIRNTQWHNIVIWGKLAEIVEKYLKKGSEVALEGSLIHRSYEASSGQRRYISEINAYDLTML